MTDVLNHSLIHQLKKGDPAAFDLLYERYWKQLFSMAYHRTADEDTSKDIVQNVFISIWQNRDSLKPNTNLEAFLKGAIKFQTLKHFRSEKVKEKVLEHGMKTMAQACYTMHELRPYLELESAIEKQIEKLPERMKKAIKLRNEEYSIREIADMLKVNEQTVSNNISEGLKLVRENIKLNYIGDVVALTIVLGHYQGTY